MILDQNVILSEDVHNSGMEHLYRCVMDAFHEAIREGIKANSIVINKNMVKVPERFGEWPAMICGLNCYVTADDLPDGYSFSVVEDKHKPMTNADRIRAMTDEELAENLCDKRLTKEMWLKWLKQPAEGDA